jgi:PRTRC genetic system protein F
LFSSRRLQSIAAGNGDVAEVARCLLGIVKLVGRKNVAGSLDNTELDAIASSAVLCWDHDDMTDRIVDDVDRAINECESGTDLTGIERVAIDGVSFRKWLKKRTETLCLIKQIDQLIELVSDPIKED